MPTSASLPADRSARPRPQRSDPAFAVSCRWRAPGAATSRQSSNPRRPSSGTTSHPRAATRLGLPRGNASRCAPSASTALGDARGLCDLPVGGGEPGNGACTFRVQRFSGRPSTRENSCYRQLLALIKRQELVGRTHEVGCPIRTSCGPPNEALDETTIECAPDCGLPPSGGPVDHPARRRGRVRAWLGRARSERRPAHPRGLCSYDGGLRNGIRAHTV